jgi:hypothetical protein
MEVTLDEVVLEAVIRLVQKLHVLSHPPASSHVGQKSTAHMSIGQSVPMQVLLQKASPRPFTWTQVVSVIEVELAVIVVVLAVTELEVSVRVESVEVLSLPVEVVVRLVEDSVVVWVEVLLSWQKPQVVSHRCMAMQVGQNVRSQSATMFGHTAMQSASFEHVVVVSVPDTVVVVETLVVVVVIVLPVVPVPVVVETVMVVIEVPLEVEVMENELVEVVVVSEVDVLVVVTELRVVDSVVVWVVQKPHSSSHIPASVGWQPGQKRVLHAASHLTVWHVALQNESGIRFTDTHGVKLDAVVVVVAVELVKESVVEVVLDVVLSVVEVVVPESVVAVPVVSEDVLVMVTLPAQIPQYVSQM